MNESELIDFAESLMDDGKSLIIKMKGFSMYPTLRPGDLGYVERCGMEDIRVGDIIVFRNHKQLVAHRLMKLYHVDGQLRAESRGDNNREKDQVVISELNLFGKLVAYEHKGKKQDVDSPRMKRLERLFAPDRKKRTRFYAYELRGLNFMTGVRNRLTGLRSNLKMCAEGSGRLITWNAVLAVLQGVLPFAVILCVKLLVDRLSAFPHNGSVSLIAPLLIATAVVFLLNMLVSELKTYSSEKLAQQIIGRMYGKLHYKHIELGLSHYENPKELDKIHRAVQEAAFRPVKLINEMFSLLRSLAASLFMLGIFLSIQWYLVIILAVAIVPDIIVRLRYSRRYHQQKEKHSPTERKMFYFNRILTGFPFAKELKLFRFADYFLLKFRNAQNYVFEGRLKLRRSEVKSNILSQTFSIILIFLSLTLVTMLMIQGSISLGTVVLFLLAFQRGYAVLNDLFRSMTRIVEDNMYLNDFVDFLALKDRTPELESNAIFSLNKGIDVKNVSFGYETSKRNALNDINLNIPAGKTVAFVGMNGSGKTTLIKLLCGFYLPSRGKVLYDNVSTAALGRTKICENIAAVFQDFALYNISAKENIALGDIFKNPKKEHIHRAAHQAGIDAVLDKLPNGYNTILGNQFSDGEELSLGQWQKLAIARAIYRDAPLLLLDEPSSALDAVSEQKILESLKSWSRDKTTVIISHRLSSVEWVDLIYMFEEGRIVESGSHLQLMDKKGKYYELFQSVIGK